MKARVIRYRTLYADPPWPERGGGRIVRGAQRHYPLMSVQDIAIFLIKKVTYRLTLDAHMYLWTTNTFMPSALWVIQHCGFRYVTTITWTKDRIGLGQYYRGLTEHCLFAVRGRLPYRILPNGKRAQGVTGFMAPKSRHSEKPQKMREMIERVSYGPYLELFGRRRVPGWTVLGNEVRS